MICTLGLPANARRCYRRETGAVCNDSQSHRTMFQHVENPAAQLDGNFLQLDLEPFQPGGSPELDAKRGFTFWQQSWRDRSPAPATRRNLD